MDAEARLQRFYSDWALELRKKELDLSIRERALLELERKPVNLERRKQGKEEAFALKRKQDEPAETVDAGLFRVLSALSQHNRSKDRFIRKAYAWIQLDNLLRASLPEDCKRNAKIDRLLKVAMRNGGFRATSTSHRRDLSFKPPCGCGSQKIEIRYGQGGSVQAGALWRV